MPNATVAGARKTAAGAAVPVPVRETVCGLDASLSAMLRAALSLEVVEGLKTTAMVQLELAAKVVVHVDVPCVKSDAFVPVKEMAIPVSAVEESLNKVIVLAELDVLTI